MRLSTLLFFCIALSTFAHGQTCLSGGITLTSQQRIDDFPTDYPGCTEILGQLSILESVNGDIVNLDGLSQLIKVGDNLTIQSNTQLNDLNGLSNIDTIGRQLFVKQNDALSSLVGMQGVNHIGLGITIENNTSLINLQGLEGLSNLNNDVAIENNNSLQTLNGTENWNSINGELSIGSNPALLSISELSNLQSINGQLWVDTNPLLTSLTGLENIDHTTITNLLIFNNPLLSTCEVSSICDYLDITSNTASIFNNATGCDSRIEVETACTALPLEWYSPLTAHYRNDIIELNWSVANQVKNDYFQVEKSHDEISFSPIGYIDGESYLLTIHSYSFTDSVSQEGLKYYRIAQFDENGNHSFSNVASARIAASRILVFPNPAANELEISSNYRGNVIIFDSVGRIKELFQKTDEKLSINISHMPNGMYFIKFINGEYTRFNILRWYLLPLCHYSNQNAHPMKKKIIKLFEKRIAKLYSESRDLLLASSSYDADNINLKNIHLFLAFVENTLEKPYNRLRTISVFVNDPDEFRTELMYPFLLLENDIKKIIGEKESESVNLATALDVGEIDSGYTTLWKEEQISIEE